MTNARSPIANQPLTTLFHIVTSEQLNNDSDGRLYRPQSLAQEGFIHLSLREQVLGSANAFFKGQQGLQLLELEIPPTDLKLKWEKAVDRDELFPHYYGPIELSWIKRIYTFEAKSDGTITLPVSETIE